MVKGFNVARSKLLPLTFLPLLLLSDCHDKLVTQHSVCLPDRLYSKEQIDGLTSELKYLQVHHIQQREIDRRLSDYLTMERDNIIACGNNPEAVEDAGDKKKQEDDDDGDIF